MKKVVLAAGAAILLSSCSAEAQSKTLYDVRLNDPRPASQAGAEIKKTLLSAVFPKCLAVEEECDATLEDAQDLSGPQAAGQIVPRLGSGVPGTFTVKGAHETAYLVSVGECGSTKRSRATQSGTYRLSVFDGTRLRLSRPTRGEYIAAVADVNEDGLDEILIVGCGFGAGELTCSASVVSVSAGHLETLQEFFGVYIDSCGAQGVLPGAAIKAGVIHYFPGKTPKFTMDEYVAACPAAGKRPRFKGWGVK